MTERDTSSGDGFRPAGSTYPGSGNPAREFSSNQPSGTTSASEVSSAVHSAARDAGNSLKEKAAEDWQAVKASAQEQVSRVGQQARDAAGEQKDFAAARVGGIASAIERVGTELEQGDQAEVGRYARQIGSSLQNFADDLKGKDLGQIAAMAEDFGRRQPAAFLGIAALAGFAASRFLTASTDRRDPRPEQRGSAGLTGNGTASSSTSPVSPTTGAGYATGYNPEGRYNG